MLGYLFHHFTEVRLICGGLLGASVAAQLPVLESQQGIPVEGSIEVLIPS